MENIVERDRLPNFKEESFGERIICESDVLMNVDDTSNGDKFENETQFEFLDTTDNSKIHIIPVSQDILDIKPSWNRIMTKALIEEYTLMLGQFRAPVGKQKDVWKELAKKMQNRGFKVTWEMCDRKFRNLKQTYRTIYYSNRSEKKKRLWEYYTDLSFLIQPLLKFNRNKSVSPPSSPRSPQSQDSFVQETNAPQCSQTNEQAVRVCRTTPQPQISQAQSDKEPPPWFKEFLKQFKAGQENMLANIRKMHNESRQLELRKMKLLENILSMLNEKNKN